MFVLGGKIMNAKLGRDEEFKRFVENIRDLRIKNGLSKTQMAEKLDVSVYTIRKLENGIMPKRLSIEVVFKIEKEFGIKASKQFL